VASPQDTKVAASPGGRRTPVPRSPAQGSSFPSKQNGSRQLASPRKTRPTSPFSQSVASVQPPSKANGGYATSRSERKNIKIADARPDPATTKSSKAPVDEASEPQRFDMRTLSDWEEDRGRLPTDSLEVMYDFDKAGDLDELGVLDDESSPEPQVTVDSLCEAGVLDGLQLDDNMIFDELTPDENHREAAANEFSEGDLADIGILDDEADLAAIGVLGDEELEELGVGLPDCTSEDKEDLADIVVFDGDEDDLGDVGVYEGESDEAIIEAGIFMGDLVPNGTLASVPEEFEDMEEDSEDEQVFGDDDEEECW